MGCLIGLFTLPIAFIRWVFTNGVKGYIVGGVVVIALLVGFFMIRGAVHEAFTPDKPPVTQQAVLPARSVAPYEVKTNSRTYYAKLAVKDKSTGAVTMTDYYELLGGRWTLTKGVLVLDKNYGTVTVTKRAK